MKHRRLLAVVASVFTTAAAAQGEPDVARVGKWSATIIAADGHRQSARFVLHQFSGEWIGAGGKAAATGSACAGKKLPITVQESTAATLEFTVWGSQVSAKCADLTIETKSVGEEAFEGSVANVGTVRIVRR